MWRLAASAACLKRAGWSPVSMVASTKNDFLQLHALSERLGVVEEGVGEILVDEPEAGEGVAFDEGEEGIETGLFKA